jgi:hypothetical protein
MFGNATTTKRPLCADRAASIRFFAAKSGSGSSRLCRAYRGPLRRPARHAATLVTRKSNRSGRDKHLISIFKPAGFDTIDPDNEVRARKGDSRFGCRANKIGDDRASSFDYPITHPAHAMRVLDTIFASETKIARPQVEADDGLRWDTIC